MPDRYFSFEFGSGRRREVTREQFLSDVAEAESLAAEMYDRAAEMIMRDHPLERARREKAMREGYGG